PRGRGTGAVLGALPVPLLRPLRFPQYRIPHLAAPEDPLDHPGGRGALRGAPRPLFLVPLPLFSCGQPEHPLSRPPPEPLRRPPMLTPTLHRHRRHVHHGSRHRGSQPYREPPEDYPHPDHHHPFGSQRSVLGSPYSPGLVPSGPTRTSSGHATHLPTITVPPSGAHADVHRHSITCRCRPIAPSACPWPAGTWRISSGGCARHSCTWRTRHRLRPALYRAQSSAVPAAPNGRWRRTATSRGRAGFLYA